MKTELRAVPHAVLRGVTVIEVWYDGRFIAQLTGAEGPGVRVISKHAKTTRVLDTLVLEVGIHY